MHLRAYRRMHEFMFAVKQRCCVVVACFFFWFFVWELIGKNELSSACACTKSLGMPFSAHVCMRTTIQLLLYVHTQSIRRTRTTATTSRAMCNNINPLLKMRNITQHPRHRHIYAEAIMLVVGSNCCSFYSL